MTIRLHLKKRGAISYYNNTIYVGRVGDGGIESENFEVITDEFTPVGPLNFWGLSAGGQTIQYQIDSNAPTTFKVNFSRMTFPDPGEMQQAYFTYGNIKDGPLVSTDNFRMIVQPGALTWQSGNTYIEILNTLLKHLQDLQDSKFAEFDKAFAEYKQDITTKLTTLTKLVDDATTKATADIKTINDRITQLNADIKADIEKLEKMVSDADTAAQAKIQELKDDFKKAQDALDDAINKWDLAARARMKTTADSWYEDLKAEAQKQADALAQAKTDCEAELAKAKADFETQVGTVSADMQKQLDAKVAILTTALADVDAKKAQVDSILADIKAENDKFKTDREADFKKLQDQFDNLKDLASSFNLKDVLDRVGKLETSQKSQDTTISGQDKRITVIESTYPEEHVNYDTLAATIKDGVLVQPVFLDQHQFRSPKYGDQNTSKSYIGVPYDPSTEVSENPSFYQNVRNGYLTRTNVVMWFDLAGTKIKDISFVNGTYGEIEPGNNAEWYFGYTSTFGRLNNIIQQEALYGLSRPAPPGFSYSTINGQVIATLTDQKFIDGINKAGFFNISLATTTAFKGKIPFPKFKVTQVVGKLSDMFVLKSDFETYKAQVATDQKAQNDKITTLTTDIATLKQRTTALQGFYDDVMKDNPLISGSGGANAKN